MSSFRERSWRGAEWTGLRLMLRYKVHSAECAACSLALALPPPFRNSHAHPWTALLPRSLPRSARRQRASPPPSLPRGRRVRRAVSFAERRRASARSSDAKGAVKRFYDAIKAPAEMDTYEQDQAKDGGAARAARRGAALRAGRVPAGRLVRPRAGHKVRSGAGGAEGAGRRRGRARAHCGQGPLGFSRCAAP